MKLLDVRNLSVIFETESGVAKAVDDFSFSLDKGKVLGIVGESGCGKSVTSLSILRLISSPGKVLSGKIIFAGQDLLTFSDAQMRQIRGNKIALVPQDPMTSLNPVYTIGYQVMEAIILHQQVSRREARQRTIEVLEKVRIPSARSRVDNYPHEFSGGMRQRVMIGMALACEPELLIADEPTTALDVTVQAQILDLMREIQKAQGTSIMMITHDLGVVAEMCDDVVVMYAGSAVEQATVRDLFARAKHPYTKGLLESIPRQDSARLTPIDGQPPSLINLPESCRFAPRCTFKKDICLNGVPLLEEKAAGQFARCVLVEARV